MQPATEQGVFFLPPCLKQCWNPVFALVVHPLVAHVPCAPCLVQRPRATARVSQSFTLHSFVLPPPCLAHLPLLCAAVLQLPNEQNPYAPCFAQTRLATTLLGQSGVEHNNTLMSCALHSPLPLLLAFLLHPHMEQIPWAPCMAQTNLPGTAGVLQGGIAWQKPAAPPCF